MNIINKLTSSKEGEGWGHLLYPGNRNKGKGNGAGLAWESQSHCFEDKFGKPYTHSFGTDTQHDYSQEIAEQCCQL